MQIKYYRVVHPTLYLSSYRKENSYIQLQFKTPQPEPIEKKSVVVWQVDFGGFCFHGFMNRYRLAGCSALILKVVVVLEGKNTRNLVMG